SGAGVMHQGELTTDETWSAAQSPHIVTADVVIRGGRKLTIEECALVLVRGHASIVVGANLVSDGTGTLVAHGSYQAAPEIIRPVGITAEDQAAWWGSLQVWATGLADLGVVVLDRGGDPSQS